MSRQPALTGTPAHDNDEPVSPMMKRLLSRRPSGGALAAELVAFALFAAVFCSMCIAWPMRIHHDCALFLQVGDLILSGMQPYVDIVDINPPLIMYANVIPALLAKLTGLHPIVAFNLCVTSLVLASALGIWGMIRCYRTDVSPWERAKFIAAYLVASGLVWGMTLYGQREHLFVLAYLPMLVLRWLRYDGAPIRPSVARAIGTCAGLGLCLKVHLVLSVMAVEAAFLVRAYRGRTWSIRALWTAEIQALLAVGLAYAAVLLSVRGIRHEYLGRFVPMFARGYGVYDAPHGVWQQWEVQLCLIASLVGLLPWRRPQGFGALVVPMAAFTLATIAVYGLQGKGWIYQLVPAVFGSALLVTCILSGVRWLPGAAALALGALASYAFVVHGISPSSSGRTPAVEVISTQTRPDDAVLVVSTAVNCAYPPLTELRRRPGSRYLWFPMLRMFYRGEHRYRHWDEAPPQERQLLEDLRDDVEARRPKLILARRGEAAARWQFHESDWLIASGFVDRAMSQYTRTPDVDGLAVWHRRD